MKQSAVIAVSFLFFLSSGCAQQTQSQPVSEASSDTEAAPASEEADFSPVKGTWHCETNTCTLTVYDNGGYHLEYGDEKKDGYLEDTQSDPPAYKMMLEDNTQWENNAQLSVDPQHPGTITLSRGLGAELLLPGEAEAAKKDDEDFGPVIGIWNCETGSCKLTIREYGKYELQYGDDTVKGYLKRSETDPAAYQMMLEDDTQWENNAQLSVDPQHPGTLTLSRGLGAELLVPDQTDVKPEETPDFSSVVGIWDCQSGSCRLTVLEYGSYELQYGDDLVRGYLKPSEKDPAVFDILLDDDTQWADNAQLFADSQHPGTLTLTRGLGAELLDPVPMEHKADASDSLVSVSFLDKDQNKLEVIDLSSSDNPAYLLFTADKPVKNFRILGLNFLGFDSNGKPGFLTGELYMKEDVKAGDQFAVKADIYGTFPNLGYCYDEESSTVPVYHYITISGYDGSLVITPFWD